MLLAAVIADRASGNVWGRDDLDSPTALRADNLYSGVVEKRGVAIWAVTWRQKWTPEPLPPGEFDDLLRVVATWDLDAQQDGEPSPTDTIKLEGGS